MTNISEKEGKEERNQLEDSFDLAGLLLDYLGNWKWFLLSVVICMVAAYYYIATIIPTYQVTASLYLNGEDADPKAKAVSLSENSLMNYKDFLDETELEIMKSRNNIIKVVDSLGLAYSYAEIGRLRNQPIYGTNPISVKLDSLALDTLNVPIKMEMSNLADNVLAVDLLQGEEKQRFEIKEFPDTLNLPQGQLVIDKKSEEFKGLSKPLSVQVLPPAWVAARVSGGLSIQFAENSFTIVRVAYNTPIIQEGKDVVNAMVHFYNEDIIADKNRAAIQTEAFIKERLLMIKDELKVVEAQLEQYQRQNNAYELQRQTNINLSVKSEAQSQLVALSADRANLEAARRAVASSGDGAPIYVTGLTPDIQAKVEEYNKKIDQLSRLGNFEEGTNANVDKIKREIPALRRGIESAIDQAISSKSRQISSLQGQVGHVSGELAADPTKDKGLQEIFRDQQVKNNIYTFLLQKREEIALQKNLATPTARLIDDPSGSGPVSPKTTMIYGIAILIGLVIPGLFIYLRRLIFPVFKDKDELERVTSVPVLSEIGKMRKPDLLMTNADASPEAELFKLLRNNVQFILRKGKVILITSSLSGEGKTFVASNLAIAFALTGKKVLVVGLDIRRPVLAHSFGLSNREGITTYLCGHADNWQALVQPAKENENLFVLPAGPVPPNPNELLLSDRLDKFFEEAREVYDYVVIDSAPIGLVSDTLLVARVSDVQLYVARASYSTRRCIKMMHQAINSGRFEHPYLILNGVNMRSNAYRYRRYGSYGLYGSHGKNGYGYGYTETPKPMSRLKRIWRKARKK